MTLLYEYISQVDGMCQRCVFRGIELREARKMRSSVFPHPMVLHLSSGNWQLGMHGTSIWKVYRVGAYV